jgi:hypothetical protein
LLQVAVVAVLMAVVAEVLVDYCHQQAQLQAAHLTQLPWEAAEQELLVLEMVEMVIILF